MMTNFIPGKSIVPVSGQTITDEDKKILHQVVDKGWYTDYVWCEKFRRELRKVTGKEYVILTNSGSSASLVAITAMLKVHPEIKCILTSATGFPTTVAPIYQNCREPIYVDIDPDTLAPDYDQIQEANDYWKCRNYQSLHIFAHTLGFPFQEYNECFRDNFTIFDCCDALGAEIKSESMWHHVGKFADIMTLSFFPAHHITTGEGGAVLTNDAQIASMADKLVSWGRDCYCEPGQNNTCGKRFEWEFEGLPKGWDHKYTFTELGYNLKMTEFQAALGFSQIQRLSTFVEKRRENYQYLKDGLNDVTFSIKIPDWSDPSPFGFPVTAGKEEVLELIAHLEKHKVQTRRVFGGNLMRQPAFATKAYQLAVNREFWGSDFVMENMFWIGCHPQLTKEMLDYVIEVFGKFYNER